MNRHRNQLAEALRYQLVNPFAQSTRLAAPGPPLKYIRTEDDIPSSWRGGITSELTKKEETPAAVVPKAPPAPDDNKRKRDQPDKKRVQRPLNMEVDWDGTSDAADNSSSNRASTQARTASANVGGKAGGHETPVISIPPQFGFKDVITTVQTGTNYFSVIALLGQTTGIQYRLTSIIDRSPATLATPVADAAHTTTNVFNKVINYDTMTKWPTPVVAFPTNTEDGLQWRKLWNKMYGYYHVIGVEWELTVMNAQKIADAPAVVAVYYDSYSASQATLVHPASATIQELEQWPDVQIYNVNSSADGNLDGCTKTIKGYYYPGKAKTNVENDEDVKTWTQVGNVPDLTEMINFRFYGGWLSQYTTKLNCRFKSRLIVQYRDLVPALRWPTTGQTAVTLNLPTDALAGV